MCAFIKNPPKISSLPQYYGKWFYLCRDKKRMYINTYKHEKTHKTLGFVEFQQKKKNPGNSAPKTNSYCYNNNVIN